MPRLKKKPDYDPDSIRQALLSAVVEVYENPAANETAPEDPSHTQLRIVAREFDMTPLKVRKILITAGVYQTELSEDVNRLYAEGKSISDIQIILGLSRSSVHGYLPYSKTIYKMEELSVEAERIRLYRERKAAVRQLQEAYPRWGRELACQISWIRCFGIHWYCLRGIRFI